MKNIISKVKRDISNEWKRVFPSLPENSKMSREMKLEKIFKNSSESCIFVARKIKN